MSDKEEVRFIPWALGEPPPPEAVELFKKYVETHPNWVNEPPFEWKSYSATYPE